MQKLTLETINEDKVGTKLTGEENINTMSWIGNEYGLADILERNGVEIFRDDGEFAFELDMTLNKFIEFWNEVTKDIKESKCNSGLWLEIDVPVGDDYHVFAVESDNPSKVQNSSLG